MHCLEAVSRVHVIGKRLDKAQCPGCKSIHYVLKTQIAAEAVPLCIYCLSKSRLAK